MCSYYCVVSTVVTVQLDANFWVTSGDILLPTLDIFWSYLVIDTGFSDVFPSLIFWSYVSDLLIDISYVVFAQWDIFTGTSDHERYLDWFSIY